MNKNISEYPSFTTALIDKLSKWSEIAKDAYDGNMGSLGLLKGFGDELSRDLDEAIKIVQGLEELSKICEGR